MLRIGLQNIEMYGYHGVFDEERQKGTHFFTDVEVWYKGDKSIKTDNLEDTFDYQIIFDVVLEEMDIPSQLIENLAGRIVENLSKKDKRIKKIKIKIAKKNPPIAGKAEFSTVTIKRKVN